MTSLDGKNVVITGAARSVGQTVAKVFAEAGASILIVDYQPADATINIIKNVGGTAHYIQCDIRDEDQVIAMGKQVGEIYDARVDILINNAGYNGYYNLIKDMTLSEWEDTLRINLTGTMLVSREIIPHMIPHKAGNIVITASNVAKRGLPYRSDYVCSKWALLGFTQTLALELVDYGIRVNAICPGPITGDTIESIMEGHSKIEGRPMDAIRHDWTMAAPMKRFIEPEEVASVMKFLCTDSSSAMTGQALNITGGFLMN